MSLSFNISSCVRAKSKNALCNSCVEVSNEKVTIVENLPNFKAKNELLACVGVCPTEAFSYPPLLNFFFNFIEEKNSILTINKELPSLLVLNIEALVSFALVSSKPLTIVSNKEELELLEPKVKEASLVLNSFGFNEIILEIEEKEKEKEEPSRREFLGKFSIKGALETKRDFDELVQDKSELNLDDIAKIKEKNIPTTRKLLLTALKKLETLKNIETIEEKNISFTSLKTINENCTNCQICYRVCPTEALFSNNSFSTIFFNPLLCVKCHLCHDVCEVDAIEIQKEWSIKEFLTPKQKTLIEFNIKRCNECGNPFPYKGGEKICSRCKIEEDEALTLQGFNK